MEVVGLLARVACVFGLLFLALHLLRKVNGRTTTRRASAMQVLGSTRLGKGAALTVVRIGDSEYVLGVTDHSVTLITPATPASASAPALAPAPAPAPAATPAATPAAPAASAAPADATAPGGRPDFAAALGARLGSRLANGSPEPLQVPPTPAEFLRSAYRVARRRPAESTDLSTDAVTAALASVRGEEPTPVTVPAPRSSSDGPTTTARTASTPRPQSTASTSSTASTPPVAADGSAAPASRHALRRAVARTEALRHEEPQWPRSSRPASRTATPGGLLV